LPAGTGWTRIRVQYKNLNAKPTPNAYLTPLAICFFAICLSLDAQQTPVQRQFEHLAEQTAKKVAKTDARRILTTPLSGCLGEPQLCANFDTVLRTNLERQVAGVQFIDRDEAVKHLAEHGFLSVDAYMGALDSVGYDVGAEVVIGENFQRNRNTCHLHTTVTDAKHHYALGDFSKDVPCTVATKTKLSLLKDPASGVFLIVPLPELPDTPTDESHIVYPSCLSCPDPHYTGDAKERGIQGTVRILITVTDHGTVENAKGLGAVEVGLAMASVRAVSGWQLKPAVGPDGKPFPARVPVEVTFRLLP
jgi:TonB family protein